MKCTSYDVTGAYSKIILIYLNSTFPISKVPGNVSSNKKNIKKFLFNSISFSALLRLVFSLPLDQDHAVVKKILQNNVQHIYTTNYTN